MYEDKQIIPLAPEKYHPKNDEEYAIMKPKTSRQEKSSKCLVYLLAGIVIVSVIVLVLASVVLRAKAPDVKLSLVTVEKLKYGNQASPLPSLNMTFSAEIRIKNLNFGRFEFENTTTSVVYGKEIVGEAKLSKGYVVARNTKWMNITADVRSYRLSNTTNLTSDINSGILKLSSHAKLRGRVQLMGILKKSKTSVMSCTMNLNLASSSIQDLVCS